MDEPEVTTLRLDRRGIRAALGDLEADIMEVIWERPVARGTTVREVFEVLNQRRAIAYTTVMNTMARLARKQFLRADRTDATYVYYPTFARDEFMSRFVGRLLESLLVSLTGADLESSSCDPATAARARQLLEEINRLRSTREAE